MISIEQAELLVNDSAELLGTVCGICGLGDEATLLASQACSRSLEGVHDANIETARLKFLGALKVSVGILEKATGSKTSQIDLRRYRDALLASTTLKCACSNPRHSTECGQGRLMMMGSIATLSWLIGDNPEHQEALERIAEIVATS